MRVFRTRTRVNDATFDLNLAPFLDIIVATIPMLLLSVAFIQVKMIETPVPQVVSEIMAKQRENPPTVSITLNMTKNNGFVLVVMDKGKEKQVNVEAPFNYPRLTEATLALKRDYPNLFRMEFKPGADVAYDDIIRTMDAVRRIPAGQVKVAFLEEKSGKNVETDLMFPDVIFANVVGE